MSPRPKLQFGQVVGDFRAIPIYRTDEFAADDTAAVDDVGFRPASSAVQGRALLRFVTDRDEVHAIVFQELVVGRFIGIDADAHHGHTILLKLALHLDQRWHFLNARRTPTGPKVEHDHLSAELAERDLMVGILHGKVWGVLADARRTAAAIASSQGGE